MPVGERGLDTLGGEHAGEDRVVRTLDARHVDEAGRAADQRPAREDELWHGLPASLGDRARTVGEALAALERRTDQRMLLEALEFLERRDVGIAVVEMHHEADNNLPVLQVIEERAAAG